MDIATVRVDDLAAWITAQLAEKGVPVDDPDFPAAGVAALCERLLTPANRLLMQELIGELMSAYDEFRELIGTMQFLKERIKTRREARPPRVKTQTSVRGLSKRAPN